MKRWLCALLAALWTALGAAALAETAGAADGLAGGALLGRGEDLYVEGMFALGDCLVLYGNDVCTYRPGDDGISHYEFDFGLEDEARDVQRGFVFADGGELRGVAFAMRWDAQYRGKLDAALIGGVELTDDGRAVLTDPVEVQWPEALIERYDGGEMPATLRDAPLALGGKLYLNTYGGAYALDLAAMSAEELELPRGFSLHSILPYVDGKALLYGSSDAEGAEMLYVLDGATGETAALCALDGSLGERGGFAADPRSGAVWCAADGAVRALDTGTGAFGAPQCDMPLMVYGSNKACLFGGHYYAMESNGTVLVRDLERAAQPSARLKVYDGEFLDWTTDAYFAFTSAHPEVSVTISRDYTLGERLVSDMLSRSAGCDVYIVSASAEAFAALRDRGYLYGLGGSAAIAGAFAEMYPALAEALSRGGEPVAVPVDASARALGVSLQALERIGMSADDLPSNWPDFFDFLDELPAHMAKDPRVMAFNPSISQSDAHSMLLEQILRDYQNHAAAAMDIPSVDTPLLRGLLERLERVDFAALGLPEEVVGDSFSWAGDEVLFDSGASVAFEEGYYDAGTQPLLLALDGDLPPALGLEVRVAFVNPYSENAEMAVAFLEALSQSVPGAIQYNFYPGLDEPLPSPERDAALAAAQEACDELQAQYERADPIDRQALADAIEDQRAYMAQIAGDMWAVSEEQIAWFRAHDGGLVVAGESWFSGEAGELTAQYAQGRIDADQYLRQVENKVRMRAMEG